MSKSTNYALTVLAAPELSVGKDSIKKLQSVIADEFATIRRIDREGAARFTLIGLMLHRLKASLPRGQFRPYLEQMLPKVTFWSEATAVKNASLAMRLSLVFIEKAKVSTPDLLSMSGDQLMLDAGSSKPAKKLLKKLDGFVGDLTRTELLIKHGLTGVGLRTALEQGDDPTPPADPQMDFFADLAERVHGYREIITSRETLKRMTPAQLDQLYAEESDLHARFVKLYEEAKGTVQI